MKLAALLTDFSLLKTNSHFRNVFIARTLSLLTIGMLVVAIPKQIYDMTGNSFDIALAIAIEGIAMFIGLLCGGVLSDRHDRKKLILSARTLCGIGFVGLAINAMMTQPSLSLIYILAAWDGFFGALGVTAMMSIMPMIVGRENIAQARAISMLAVRLATVISPAIGGVLIAFSYISNVYWIAAVGTLLTVLTLLGLPKLKPQHQDSGESPIQQLMQGFRFVFRHKIVGSTILIGTLLGFSSAIRIFFPEMVEKQFQGGAFELGLMYSVVPLGATLGALLSKWAIHLQQPGRIMLYLCLGVFSCIILIGIVPWFYVCCILLVIFGYLMSIANLLQYSIVQGHTPDDYLGRINAIWLAQDASSDSLATTAIGFLTRFVPITTALLYLGSASFLLGLFCLIQLKSIRQAPMHDPALQDSP